MFLTYCSDISLFTAHMLYSALLSISATQANLCQFGLSIRQLPVLERYYEVWSDTVKHRKQSHNWYCMEERRWLLFVYSLPSLRGISYRCFRMQSKVTPFTSSKHSQSCDLFISFIRLNYFTWIKTTIQCTITTGLAFISLFSMTNCPNSNSISTLFLWLPASFFFNQRFAKQPTMSSFIHNKALK